MKVLTGQILRTTYHLVKRTLIRSIYKDDMTKIDHCTMSPELWIAHCCEIHDIAYVLGGTKEDRKRADDKFYECMINSELPNCIATIYWWSTRTAGRFLWNYKIKEN